MQQEALEILPQTPGVHLDAEMRARLHAGQRRLTASLLHLTTAHLPSNSTEKGKEADATQKPR